jgi:CBS domain-containing protein
MKAHEVMSVRVYTVRPEDPVSRAVALICQHHISGVPVVNRAGDLVGLISERDILGAMYPGKSAFKRRRGASGARGGLRELKRLRAEDIMVRQVITAPPEADLLLLASLMATRKIRRIPIVVGQRLVGIVSQGDVYRGIFQGRRRDPLEGSGRLGSAQLPGIGAPPVPRRERG